MKKAVLAFFIAALAVSCQKDKRSSEAEIIMYSMPDEVFKTNIYPLSNQVGPLIVSESNDKTRLIATFELSAGAIAMVKGIRQWSSTTPNDFTNPLVYTVIAENGKSKKEWKVVVINLTEYFGLGLTLKSRHSNNRIYEWYIDQANTGVYSGNNCGPTSTTMAIKWADSTFDKTPQYARNMFMNGGGWWYTSDISNYFDSMNISHYYIDLPDQIKTIKNNIDNGYILILCLDMNLIRYNEDPVQRTDKFYTTTPGWGHFIVIKGYKEVDNKFFFEAYDPNSWQETYSDDNTFKGKNRYYRSEDIETATNAWWDYAIVIIPRRMKAMNIGTVKSRSEVPDAYGR